jgi:hypothetical protein
VNAFGKMGDSRKELDNSPQCPDKWKRSEIPNPDSKHYQTTTEFSTRPHWKIQTEFNSMKFELYLEKVLKQSTGNASEKNICIFLPNLEETRSRTKLPL